MQKKVIPYGNHFITLFADGVRPKNDIYVFCGTFAWQRCTSRNQNKTIQPALCLPPWDSAFNYVWPVRGYDILVFDTGNSDIDYLEEIALCVLEAGAQICRIVDMENKLSIYRKESLNEQES